VRSAQEVGGTLFWEDGLVVMAGAESVGWDQGFLIPFVMASLSKSRSRNITTHVISCIDSLVEILYKHDF
jgi:Tfp pilus assembly ATPase PilU